MARLFFSYSHRDEVLRDELEVHLATLKRQGIIESWHDRRVGAGKEFDHEISEHLEEAGLILLLISPYFIASDYCYDVELQRAMERHQAGEARVIPVILQPCDWQTLSFGKLLAIPRDGKPISKFPNIHDAFLEVTIAIREAAEAVNKKTRSGPGPQIANEATNSSTVKRVPEVRSSNLRIKRTFTDRDKDGLLQQGYEYIANFFEGSLAELQKRNRETETEFKRVDANHFTAIIYVQGSETSRCRIWLGSRGSFGGGIGYKEGRSFVENDTSFNESLLVEDDGYNLFLKPLGMAMVGEPKKNLTLEGAAEYYWDLFIRRLQQ